MLYVLMTISGERYGVEASSVVEVIPAVRLTPAGYSGDSLSLGVFNYHGEKVVVVDGGLLISGRASTQSLSTRIAILTLSNGARRHLLGIMAEEMTETVKYEVEDMSDYRAEEKLAKNIEIVSASSSQRGFRILNIHYLFRTVLSI